MPNLYLFAFLINLRFTVVENLTGVVTPRIIRNNQIGSMHNYAFVSRVSKTWQLCKFMQIWR